MGLLQQAAAEVLSAVAEGPSASAGPAAWAVPVLEKNAASIPALGLAAELLVKARGGGGEDLLRAAELLFSLSRADIRLCPAPDGERLDRRNRRQDFPDVPGSVLAPLANALKSGANSRLISRAVEDGSAYSPALIPLWEDALRVEALAPAAVKVLASLAPEYFGSVVEKFFQGNGAGGASLDLAAGIFGAGALPFLRRVAEETTSEKLRLRALFKIGELSSEQEDARFLAGFLRRGRKARLAAIAALERTDAPGAGEILAEEAERLLSRLDFGSLAAVTGAMRARLAGGKDRRSERVYAFFTRLLPDLICREGDYGWLVYECVEAVALFDGPGPVSFLEQMLSLAEHMTKKERPS